MQSPLTISVANVDISTPEVTAQQQAKSAITAMAQGTIQPCASDPGRIKPIISGPLEDPGTEAHKEASIEVLVVKDVLPAEEDNTNRVPTTQEGAEEALHPNLIKSATLTADRPPNPQDRLHTDVASDGQTSFHTTLQMITKQG